MFLSYCANEMGVEFNMPAILEMDNSAADVFANDTAMNIMVRPIDQRQSWVQTLRNANLVKVKHVNTKLNLADIFTKSLQGEDFRSQRGTFLHDCKEICIQGGIEVLESNIK
jgi:hypothetical protein